MAEEVLTARIVFDGSDLGGIGTGGNNKSSEKLSKMSDVIVDNERGFRNLAGPGFGALPAILTKLNPIAIGAAVAAPLVPLLMGIVEEAQVAHEQRQEFLDTAAESAKQVVFSPAERELATMTGATPEEINSIAESKFEELTNAIINGDVLGEGSITSDTRSIGEQVVDYASSPEGMEAMGITDFNTKIKEAAEKAVTPFTTETENAVGKNTGGGLIGFITALTEAQSALQNFASQANNSRIEPRDDRGFIERVTDFFNGE